MSQRILAIILILAIVGCSTSTANGGSGTGNVAGTAASVVAEGTRIGKDPSALLARVADRVRYEVYPGVFRGPVATLADGAGNDYDRALLLHDLIATADPSLPVRYAFCALSPAQADTLVAAARAADHPPRIVANSADALSAAAKEPKRRDGFAKVAAFWKAAVAQQHDATAQLASDLQNAGVKPIAPNAGDLRATVSDHVWVQVQNGTWTDLDPSVAGAKPGSTLCAAAHTADSLPDDAYDTVAATLQLETRTNDQQSVATVATGKWRTAQFGDASLTFAFAEPAGLQSPAPAPTGMRAYTPVIRAGTELTSAPTMIVLAPVAGPGVGASAGGAAVSAAQTFGTPPPATPGAAPTQPGPVPVALRLAIAVATHGVPPTSVERTIFDRIGPADRAAGRASTAKLADLSLVPFGTVWNIAVNLGTGVVGVGDYSKLDRTSDDPAALIHALGFVQRAYYGLRRATYASERGTGAGSVMTARPGVSFFGVAQRGATSRTVGLVMDRASDGAIPDGSDPTNGVAWGVASLFAERLSVAGATMMVASESGRLAQLPFADVIGMFAIGRTSSIPAKIVRNATDVAALGASDDAKARLMQSIAGGASALAPASPIPYAGANDYGWWILSPDGTVADEMQNGMHQALPEEGVTDEAAVEEAPPFRKTGFIVRCVAIAAAAMFVAASGGPEGGELAGQAAEMIHAIYEANEAEEMRQAAEKCAE